MGSFYECHSLDILYYQDHHQIKKLGKNKLNCFYSYKIFIRSKIDSCWALQEARASPSYGFPSLLVIPKSPHSGDWGESISILNNNKPIPLPSCKGAISFHGIVNLYLKKNVHFS